MDCQPESEGTLISLKLDTGSGANVVPETVVVSTAEEAADGQEKRLKVQANSWDLAPALEINTCTKCRASKVK